MAYCPRCAQRFSEGAMVCPADGTALVHETGETIECRLGADGAVHPGGAAGGVAGHASHGGAAGSLPCTVGASGVVPVASRPGGADQDGGESPEGAGGEQLAAGTLVGEYSIESPIGRGGFGSVYSATHPLIGKRAAIKVLNHACSSNPTIVSRFVAEARAVNQIRHRHIVDIFAFGSLPDGRQYLVMELLDGIAFSSYLRRHGALPPEVALPLLRGIARAVDAAHAAGIAHRDLKPENVFLVADEEGRLVPKLLDFGIAKLLGERPGTSKTATGMPLGTPLYMSPEQCHGRAVDHRTDIYSFGVMVFRVLTGHPPFLADEVLQLMICHTREEPPRPSQVASWLPAAVDPPILRMLEKDPALRPPSLGAAVNELVEALRAAGFTLPSISATSAVRPPGATDPSAPRLPELSGLPVAASSAAPAPTARHSGGRKLWLLPLLALVVVAGTIAGYLLGGPRSGGSDPAGGKRPAKALAVVGSGSGAATGSGSGAAGGGAGAAGGGAGAAGGGAGAAGGGAGVAMEQHPAMVQVTVQSLPHHAEVFLGVRLLGQAPGPFQLPRGDEPLTLRLQARGHLPAEVEFTPAADGVVAVKLTRERRRPKDPIRPATPSALENPF